MTATMPTTSLNWERVARVGMHPIAIAVLELLAVAADSDTPAWSPTHLAEVLGEPLGVVSYHVRLAKQRGLIRLVRTEPVRGALCHYYALTDSTVA